MLETLARLAAAEILVVAAVAGAYAVAAKLLPTACGATRWTAAGVVALWTATALFHALFAAGAFTLPFALACALASLGAIRLLHGPFGPVVLPLHASRAPADRSKGLARWLGRAACTCGAVVAARGLLVPVVAWDALTYHATKAGLWVQAGGPETLAAPGGWSIYRTYPGGGEILQAWAMLPLRGDLLAGLADVAPWAILGVAVWALCGKLGVDSTAKPIAVAYLLAVPATARAVGSLYVDTTLAACLVAACVLALHALEARSAAALALALAALGVAAGIKLTALPVAAAAGLTLLALTWGRLEAPRARWVLAGAGALLAVAVPWYARAWQIAGHPFSPAPVRLGSLVLGEPNDAMRWYLERPELATAGLRDELRAAGQVFGVPGLAPLGEPTLGMLSLLVVLVGAAGVVALARRDLRRALIVLSVVVPAAAPFFGTGLRATRLIWPAVSGRYLLAALGVLLAASLAVHQAAAWQRLYRGALVAAAVAYFVLSDLHGWTGRELVIAGIAGLVASLAVVALRRAGRRALVAAVFVVPLVAALALAAYRDATRENALRESVVLHPSPRYWLPAALAVDEPALPRRIAVTAGAAHDADNWLLYPFLGRRLQNELIYVPPTHEGNTIDPSRHAELAAAASYPAWLARLEAAAATEVLSFSPASIELVWMERHPEAFERRAGDGRHWGLYRRLPPSAGSPPGA